MAQNASLDEFWALYPIPSLICQPLPARSVGTWCHGGGPVSGAGM